MSIPLESFLPSVVANVLEHRNRVKLFVTLWTHPCPCHPGFFFFPTKIFRYSTTCRFLHFYNQCPNSHGFISREPQSSRFSIETVVSFQLFTGHLRSVFVVCLLSWSFQTKTWCVFRLRDSFAIISLMSLFSLVAPLPFKEWLSDLCLGHGQTTKVGMTERRPCCTR